MNIAIGSVQTTVKRGGSHGLPTRALTTTSARTASRITLISSTPTRAMPPATGPISARIMSPSERPSRRTRQKHDGQILHCAGKHHADEDPQS